MVNENSPQDVYELEEDEKIFESVGESKEEEVQFFKQKIYFDGNQYSIKLPKKLMESIDFKKGDQIEFKLIEPYDVNKEKKLEIKYIKDGEKKTK